MKRTLTIIAMFYALAGTAGADTLLTYAEAGKASREIAIAGGKVQMHMADQRSDVMFDAARRAMTVINHAERNYVVMDEARMQQMAQLANQMMQMMQNLPPQVREQMQGMMGGKGMGGLLPKIEVKETGRSDQVNGIACKLVETRVDGRMESELCIAPRSALKIAAADLKTLQAMFEFSSRITEQLEFAKNLGNEWSKLGDQVPVRMVENLEGGKRSRHELKSVSNASLPASRFAIPAGYREQKIELPQMPGMPQLGS